MPLANFQPNPANITVFLRVNIKQNIMCKICINVRDKKPLEIIVQQNLHIFTVTLSQSTKLTRTSFP